MSKMEQGFFYSEKVEMGKKKFKKKILELACFSPKLSIAVAKKYKRNKYDVFYVILFEKYAYANRIMPF